MPTEIDLRVMVEHAVHDWLYQWSRREQEAPTRLPDNVAEMVREVVRASLAEEARRVYETLPRHPGDPREGPERDVPDCPGTRLRSLWLK